jgi:hypothetical protein
MKNLLILLCTVLTFNFGYSQDQKSTTTQRVERSSNVFTGKVLSKRCYQTDKMIYTAYTIEAQTSFKGDLPTHFEIVTEGGVVNDKFVIASHTSKFSIDEEAIFFCNPNTYYPTDNQTLSSMVLSAKPVSKTNEIGYQYAYKGVLEAIGVPINQFKIKQTKSTLNSSSNKSMVTEIEYDFGNVVLSGSNNQYLEFDVQAKANIAGLDFGEAELFLEYTPQTFGTNIVGSGNIAFQKEDIILSSDYTLFVTDDAPDRIKIEVNVNNMPTNLHELSDIFAEDLLHMKIDISNFQLGSISFIGDMMQNETYHAVDNNGLSPFNNVIVPSPLFSISNVNNHQLTLTFDNQVVEIDGQNMFYEFDVVGETNNNATLNGGKVLINYNNAAFGSNLQIVSNETLRGAGATLDGYAVVGFFLNNASLLSIDIFGTPSPQTPLYDLQANIPTTLFRVRIPILDCNQDPMLSFPISADGDNLMVTYKEIGQVLLQNFNLIHNDIDNTQMCPGGVIPSISSISTNTLPSEPIGGGIGTTLTIDGQNLGANLGNIGRVMFPNANINDPVNLPQLPLKYIYADGQDDLTNMTWNNNQITIPISNINTNGDILGGGVIKVELENGGITMRISSPTELRIGFSVAHQIGSSGHFYRLIHQNNNGGGGYTFELQQNLVNLYPNALNFVNEAIHRWKCETNINFETSSSFTTNGTDINDNSNVIALGTFVDNDFKARTYKAGIIICSNSNNNEVWVITDLDIRLNSTSSWFFDENNPVPIGQEDFLAVILHEIGHAHLLDHVLISDAQGNTPVMYPFGANHNNRVLQSEDITGGDEVMNYNGSANLSGNSCTPLNFTNMISSQPDDCTNNTNYITSILTSLNIYPNPVIDNSFYVEYDLMKYSNVRLYIYNVLGQSVFQENMGEQLIGSYKKEIVTDNFSNGFYFVSLEVNGTITTHKIFIGNE